MHSILDEIISGGQVLETSSAEVVKAVEEISKCSLSLASIKLSIALFALVLIHVDVVVLALQVRNSLEFYQLCLQNSFWLAGLSLLFKASWLSDSACIPLMPCLQIITRSVVLAMTDYLDRQVNKLSYSWTTHLAH